LKTYYRVIVTETTKFYYKNRHTDQWNRIEDPETNPHSYSSLILDKVSRTHMTEKTASSTYCAGKTGYLHAKD
jgi:hypothetical protein